MNNLGVYIVFYCLDIENLQPSEISSHLQTKIFKFFSPDSMSEAFIFV